MRMLRCMRTTIRLDDDLLAAAKRRAVDNGTTLTKLIEDALRVSLARPTEEHPRARVELPVSGCKGGLMPGVDIDDSAGLLELMDEGLPLDKRR